MLCARAVPARIPTELVSLLSIGLSLMSFIIIIGLYCGCIASLQIIFTGATLATSKSKQKNINMNIKDYLVFTQKFFTTIEPFRMYIIF